MCSYSFSKIIFWPPYLSPKLVFLFKIFKIRFLKFPKNVRIFTKAGPKRHFRKIIHEKKLLEIKFYLLCMSHTSLHTTHCVVGMGSRILPSLRNWASLFHFRALQMSQPKIFSSFWAWKLEKFMKFHCPNPSSCLVIPV